MTVEKYHSVQFSSVTQSCPTLCDTMNCSTPGLPVHSWSSLRLTSIESVMLFSHLILCRPLLLLPPIPPSIRVFSNESTLYSNIKKNTFELVPMRQMKLEPIIQSEVSQKEKHQYSILTHIYGIQKDGNNNPVCETAKETQMSRTVFWILWERERWDDLGGWH